MKVFGRRETIGDYALSKLDLLKDRLENGDAPEHLIDEARRELGESVEKVLFINQALDRKESK
jgi:hypothetical protein